MCVEVCNRLEVEDDSNCTLRQSESDRLSADLCKEQSKHNQGQSKGSKLFGILEAAGKEAVAGLRKHAVERATTRCRLLNRHVTLHRHLSILKNQSSHHRNDLQQTNPAR